jgi:membrane protein implicated in regulation of membrane protease activity
MKRLLVVAVNHLMYSLSPYYVEIWLIVGVFFIIVELLHLPNIGFLFLGLGALSCGILISTFPNLTIYQWVVFGLSSALWFLVLYLPLKRYVYKKNNKSIYFDMINNEVYACNRSIVVGEMGQVKWSGTIMNATLDDSEAKEVAVGEKLYIKEVRGNTLICSRKMIL